ncbi:GNAT family N-acetyltransferase [Reinekea sp.]|uniref:GNAT family N-acetyltransferase n=1 Tax=Reinekea sp. TaxID=1970455 RepID=UPI003989B4ED
MQITTKIANYHDPRDAQQLIDLLNSYAQDPMGGGEALKPEVKAQLVATLANTPGAFTVLAFVDDQPAGIANCFQGFSTFKCKPLINIHDLAVASEFRGLKLSQLLLQKVEEIANDRGCCKVTLEVLDGNKVAKNAYLKFGYAGYELNPEMGKALFWEKPLAN